MSHEVITSSTGKIKGSVVYSIFSWLVITIQSAEKDIRLVGALQIAQQASKSYDRLLMMFLCWADIGRRLYCVGIIIKLFSQECKEMLISLSLFYIKAIIMLLFIL